MRVNTQRALHTHFLHALFRVLGRQFGAIDLLVGRRLTRHHLSHLAMIHAPIESHVSKVCLNHEPS